MNPCKTLKPNVSMVEKAGRGGPGVSVHEAVAAATTQMEVLRNDVAARMETIVTRLGALRGEMAAVESGEVRRLADELAGLGGAFGSTEIGAAASSLCRLLDLSANGAPAAASIGVHLDALQLFTRITAEARAQVAGSVLAGLRQVVSARDPGPGVAPPPRG